jgi:hypothetical protein
VLVSLLLGLAAQFGDVLALHLGGRADGTHAAQYVVRDELACAIEVGVQQSGFDRRGADRVLRSAASEMALVAPVGGVQLLGGTRALAIPRKLLTDTHACQRNAHLVHDNRCDRVAVERHRSRRARPAV